MSADETGGGPAEARQRLERKVERVQTSLRELASRESVRELRQALDIERRARRHPYGMLAAALGIGFVLGGGLFSRLGRGMVGTGVGLGLRASAVPFIERELVALLMEGGGAQGPRNKAKGEVP